MIETATRDFDAVLDAMNPPTPFSDSAMAQRFIAEHGENWRRVSVWARWMQWTGQYWRNDQTQAVIRAAVTIAHAAVNSDDGMVQSPSSQRRLCSQAAITALLSLAGASLPCAATAEQWDSDPWLLAVPGGTVSLRDGIMYAPKREDYVSKSTTVSPDGDCPMWLAHLHTVTSGDTELISYLQRAAGYALTGVTVEHVFFFCYGTGANGKSTFLDTLNAIMGSYARTANIEMFLASKQDRPTHEVADLVGARMVMVDEVKKHRRWDESRINALTSAKTINACRKYEHPFEFRPVLKLFFAGNEKPELAGGVDEAIARRIHIIPFRVTIPADSRDPYFQDRLIAEHPGILRWMIDGCLEWQRVGLSPPQVVRDATAAYLQAEDSLSGWLAMKCLLGPECSTPLVDLYASYSAHCETVGESPMRRKRLMGDLQKHGVESSSEYGMQCAAGIKLLG